MSTELPPPPTSACVRRFGAALLPAVTTGVLLADQASKLWIQQHFAACDATSLPIVPGWVTFVYTCNKGAAFGLLANETLLFVLIALVIIGVLVAYVRFLPAHRPWLRLSLGLQLGGALGNLLDRLRQGYVGACHRHRLRALQPDDMTVDHTEGLRWRRPSTRSDRWTLRRDTGT